MTDEAPTAAEVEALIARLNEIANEGRQWKLPRVEVAQELVEQAAAALAAQALRIGGYQGSRDYAIDMIAAALGIEADKIRAVEYYARLASEKIAAQARELEQARADIALRDSKADILGRLLKGEAYRAEKAEAALAERDKDAERYRFMRGEGPEVMALWKQATLDMSMTLTVLDAAIDAALRASAKD